MKYALAVFLVGIFGVAMASEKPCDFSKDALLANQREILKSVEREMADAAWIKSVSHAFSCLLKAQIEEKGIGKYHAGSLLRPLLGSPLVDGIPVDSRLDRVAKKLTRLTLQSDDLIHHSLITGYERGDWGFFAPCEGTGLKKCPVFIPEAIDKQPALIAAAQMIHLQKAYRLVEGREKREIAEQIKSLYLKIPSKLVLQRRVIDQIYAELFINVRPLSQS